MTSKETISTVLWFAVGAATLAAAIGALLHSLQTWF
jgi:hypothetical protein